MRFTKFIVPALALGMFAIIPSHLVRADNAPATTQAAAGKSVTIKVVDASGNPVEGAKVTIGAPHKHGEPAPDPVASGVTDAQGTVVLTSVPAGSYRAMATMRGVGRGNEKVTVGDDAVAPITITLKPKAAASQPAQ